MKRILEKARKASLKSKWMLAVGATIFISYALISVVLYVALQTWLINNEEKNAVRTVEDMISFFEAQRSTVTIQKLQNNNALMKAILTQEQTVRIFNGDGIEVMRINDVTPVAQFPQNEWHQGVVMDRQTIDGVDAFVVHQFVQIGAFQGGMQLIHPLATFQSMMKYILTTIIIVGAGALLFSVSISYYLANVLMKPLIQLRDAMNLVRYNGFNAQPEFRYKADDEIGDLLEMYRTLMNELEVSFTQQQQFVADASHELRTPIQVIEGHLSLLARWGKNDPAVLEESLHTSLAEITRMKKMIEELLQLARREEVDVTQGAQVETVYEQVRSELNQLYPEVIFELTVLGQPAVIAISEHALMQILRNIMSNGIRYNQLQPKLKTTIDYRNLAVTVKIQDNGIGIAPQHLPYIFDRFYRIDEARTNEISGTGLGLSITKMLVEKYQAQLNVESIVNKGTVFILDFPKK